jgi:hypothetical protein
MWVPRVYAKVEWHCIRFRFTVRSLMIVVAVAGLILALVAYEQRLRTRARYHQIKYLEYVTPVSPQARAQGVITYRSMLLDGSWSVPHLKTPQAEWHDQKKWEYHHAIVRTNFLVLASLIGSVSLWLVGKVAFGRSQRVHRKR